MAVYRTVEVDADVSKSVFSVDASVSGNGISVSAEVASKIHIADYPDYEGDYDFTPGSEAQTINMENMVVHHDIVINPIPNNYGLISWNGATLTVS